MKNCPNCGAPLEPYKCKCDFCGTWYFDFTAFDMTSDTPYYVKFRTCNGVITTLARPELQTIETSSDTVEVTNSRGDIVKTFRTNICCDLGVIFHAVPMKDYKNAMYLLEIEEDKNI